jgi:multidrug efflux pump subunit AcrA (membrane-fusion protein)
MSKPAKPKGQAQAKAPGAQAQAIPCEHAPRQGCPWLNAAATDLQLATMGEARAKAQVATLEQELARAQAHIQELEDQLTDEGLNPREALAQQKAQEQALVKKGKQPTSTCLPGCMGCQGHPGPRHNCPTVGCPGCPGQQGWAAQAQAEAQKARDILAERKQVLMLGDAHTGSGPSPLQQAVQMAQEVPNLPALQQLQKEMARKTRVGIGPGEDGGEKQ